MTELEGKLISPPTLIQQNAPKYYPLKSVQIKNRSFNSIKQRNKMKALNKKILSVHAGRISIGFLHYSAYHGLYSGRYLCIFLILLKAYSLMSSLYFKMCFFFLLPWFLYSRTSQIKYKNYSISSLIGCSICDIDIIRCFRKHKKVSRGDFFPTPGT